VGHPHDVADPRPAEVACLPGNADGVGRPAVPGEGLVEGDLQVRLVPCRELRPHDGHRGGGVAEVPLDQVPDLRGVVGFHVDALEQALREPAEVVGQAVEVGCARAFGHAVERMSTRDRAASRWA
jgi:hypothetical protein